MRVEIGRAVWRLLAGRAAYWEADHTLGLADAHFGKAASFRAQSSFPNLKSPK